MKSMKTGGLAALAFALCMFLSCTKEISTSDVAASEAYVSGVQQKNNGTLPEPGVPNNQKAIKHPRLVAEQTPNPANMGSEVTVTYKAMDQGTGLPVECGTLKIYQLVGTEWVEVKKGTAPELSYTFKVEKAGECAYQFKAGFAPGGKDVQCKGDYAGVDYASQEPFCVKVACVQELTVKPQVTAVNKGDGLYEFTISYILTSPKDVNGIKFQGGATSGGQFEHTLTDIGTMVAKDNKQNTVLKWEGDLKACTPQILYFRYVRRFSCPETDAQVAGNWSIEAAGVKLIEIAPLKYSCL